MGKITTKKSYYCKGDKIANNILQILKSSQSSDLETIASYLDIKIDKCDHILDILEEMSLIKREVKLTDFGRDLCEI